MSVKRCLVMCAICFSLSKVCVRLGVIYEQFNCYRNCLCNKWAQYICTGCTEIILKSLTSVMGSPPSCSHEKRSISGWNQKEAFVVTLLDYITLMLFYLFPVSTLFSAGSESVFRVSINDTVWQDKKTSCGHLLSGRLTQFWFSPPSSSLLALKHTPAHTKCCPLWSNINQLHESWSQHLLGLVLFICLKRQQLCKNTKNQLYAEYPEYVFFRFKGPTFSKIHLTNVF